jgi:hypothetical protein
MTIRQPPSDVDRDVRLHIYHSFLALGTPPAVAETARGLERDPAEVAAAYRRLADARAIVLRSGTLDVLMAMPLSAVPTRFDVQLGHRAYSGNCVWDAMGIPAMLHQDARITAVCGDCDERIVLDVTDGRLRGEGVIHFGVPARDWWKDIEFS